MADTGDWREKVNSSRVFSEFRKTLEDCKPLKECQSVLQVRDDLLFLWSHEDSCLLVANFHLKALNGDCDKYQIILCTAVPYFEATHLDVNRTATHVALYGKHGAMVLVLPQRWGCSGLFEGGKETCLAKTFQIGERFYRTNKQIHILRACWHPGSDESSHLTVLSSDNCIRIYDLKDADMAVQTIRLADNDSSFSARGANCSFAAALGDQSVSFDFGPQILDSKSNLMWPIYVLWGNGDVYTVLTSCDDESTNKVFGPLEMFPPAEDNYGTDACSILVTNTSPPAVVIATASGRLHHCILLNQSHETDTASEASWTPSEFSHQYSESQAPTLYVYEVVEMELELVTAPTDSVDAYRDLFSCPVKLLKDESAPSRFHCLHGAGIHSVYLSWLPRFEQFIHDDCRGDILDLLSLDDQSVVEHLICSKPLLGNSASYFRGACVLTQPLLADTLLCLNEIGESFALSLKSVRDLTKVELLIDQSGDKAQSPLRKVVKEPFDSHIRQILKRDVSNPVLTSSLGASARPDQCYQLLCRATQVFRDEYLHKQEVAQSEINRRIKLLERQKLFQLSELEKLNKDKEDIQVGIDRLRGKCVQMKEMQDSHLNRLSSLMRRIQSLMPELSDAERTMSSELRHLQAQVKLLASNIDQLKVKQEYAQSQTKAEFHDKKVAPSFTKSQMKNLRELLDDEDKQVKNLVKAVKTMKVSIDN